jgi:hypothetical protein
MFFSPISFEPPSGIILRFLLGARRITVGRGSSSFALGGLYLGRRGRRFFLERGLSSTGFAAV